MADPPTQRRPKRRDLVAACGRSSRPVSSRSRRRSASCWRSRSARPRSLTRRKYSPMHHQRLLKRCNALTLRPKRCQSLSASDATCLGGAASSGSCALSADDDGASSRSGTDAEGSRRLHQRMNRLARRCEEAASMTLRYHVRVLTSTMRQTIMSRASFALHPFAIRRSPEPAQRIMPLATCRMCCNVPLVPLPTLTQKLLLSKQ